MYLSYLLFKLASKKKLFDLLEISFTLKFLSNAHCVAFNFYIFFAVIKMVGTLKEKERKHSIEINI